MSARKPVPSTAFGRAYVGSGGSFRQAPVPVVQYKVDYIKYGGEEHARERHTPVGIWAAGKVLTDHPDFVAVFENEAALQAALAAMPTASDQWKRGRGGRYDAYVGDVGYQADLLGDTMDLFTCFPLRGTQYGKQFLTRLLARKPGARSADEFWALVDTLHPLEERLGRLWKPPGGATKEEISAYEEIAKRAAAAIDATSTSKAQELLDALSAKSHEIESAIDERRAKEEAERKQSEALTAATRKELNKIAEDPFSEASRAKALELYEALMKTNTPLNPATLRELKAKYGIG